MPMPVVVDLFSGAGGLAEGFRRAGFRCAFATDFDKQAVETFSFNHPGTVCLQRDVRQLEPREILAAASLSKGGVDVLCGGPPCQGFSLAGPRVADDPKNRLFLDFVRIAAALQPALIFFENVVGITSMQQGAVVLAIVREFERIGYACQHRILNAADFGVPQTRPRFILLASPKGSTTVSFPVPTHGTSVRQLDLLCGGVLSPHLTVWDAIADLPDIGPGEGDEELSHAGPYLNDYQRERRGRRSPGIIFNHRAINHAERIQRRYAMIPEGQDNRGLPEALRTKKINVWKLSRTRPSRTVTCNHRTDLLHPLQPRGTTVREAARLQSFDDDYRFFGNLTRKAAWVTQDDQVGNAVPPLLAYALACHLKTILTRR
jgi:DNA (cytosine-5)-methyltransferase 1